MGTLFLSILMLIGFQQPGEEETPAVFRVVVAPLPLTATPGVFPPYGDEVVEIWRAGNLDRIAPVRWYDLSSSSWLQFPRQVTFREPDAVIGDYQYLRATIGRRFTAYLTWSSPQPPQAAVLVTLKRTGIQRIPDLRGQIVGVIDPAYPLGGHLQRWLLQSSGLSEEETHVASLGTAREVVHHLFTGTIDAAGLPEGEAEAALRSFGFPEAASELRVIRKLPCPSRYALFVRQELLEKASLFPRFIANTIEDLYPPDSTTREPIPQRDIFSLPDEKPPDQ